MKAWPLSSFDADVASSLKSAESSDIFGLASFKNTSSYLGVWGVGLFKKLDYDI
jgi:hypothetical protein